MENSGSFVLSRNSAIGTSMEQRHRVCVRHVTTDRTLTQKEVAALCDPFFQTSLELTDN